MLFRGTGTALVTPFTAGGAIDEPALRTLVERQIRGGVEALFPVGTTGESVTLRDDEITSVVRIVVEQTRSRIPVIAGAGSNSTSRSIELCRLVLEAGADGVLVVGPYYNKPTQEGFFRHYKAIADAVDAPMVVYNVPGRTAGNIEAATTLRIAREIPAAVGVKEASGNLAQVMEILRRRPGNFGVWSGDDNTTLPLIALGADGVVSVVSNEVPKEFSTMVRACLAGDFVKARRLHYKLLSLMTVNFLESNPIPVKAVLAMMGLIEEQYRLPLVRVGGEHRAELEKAAKELGLVK